MSERELRELLGQVVPDAPRIAAGPLAAAGRRARTRRRAATAIAAAAAVAAALVLPTVLSGQASTPETVAPASDPADFDPPADEVYAAVPCPAKLPDTSASNKAIPDLDRVVGVRLCGDAGTSPMDPVPNRGPSPSYSASPDALLSGMPAFVQAVRALPKPDPQRCATIDGVSSRQALAMLLDDGSTVLVGQEFCGDNDLAGRRIDAFAVVQSFLEALDSQRETQSYGLRIDPLDCRSRSTSSPATPGREQVIDAVGCTEDGDALALTANGLELLRAAWDHPLPVHKDLDDDGENACTEPDQRPLELSLSTDRGDVVRLSESPCGYLTYDSWRLGETFQIPVAYDEVVSTAPVSSR